MAFSRKWQFNGAARLLSTVDLEGILDPETDMGAAISLVIDGLSVTGSLPAGGATGTALVKQSNASGDADWDQLTIDHVDGLQDALDATAGTLPTDGTTGQILAMESSTPGDYGWKTLAMSDISGLSGALSGKQAEDADLTAISALSHADGTIMQTVGSSWAARTPAQVLGTMTITKTTVGLSNVDNTSDADKLAASGTITNKLISGNDNTFDEIPLSAMPEVEAALSDVTSPTAFMIKYSSGWPARSTSGTSSPSNIVTYVGGPSGPAKSGTGSTGAQDNDLWVRQAP